MNLLNYFQKNKWRDFLISHYVDGYTFYTYKNVQLVHNKRQYALQVAIKQAEYGITYADLKSCIKLMQEAISKNDIGKAYTYLNVLDTYTDLAISTENIFKICDAVVLIGSEPEKVEGEEWSIIKRKAFERSEEVRGFFFRCAERTLRDMNKLQRDILIEDYMSLQIVKETESLFLKMISGKK
jgi:hypothetical protein